MPSEKKYSPWPAIIIVCLAFAAPVTIGTIEMRVARNSRAETAAIEHLQSIAKAQAAYRQSTGQYSASPETLSGLPAADPYYQYTYRKLSDAKYDVSAKPRQPGKHGTRFFYLDESGVVRYDLHGPATARSPEVPVPKESAK